MENGIIQNLKPELTAYGIKAIDIIREAEELLMQPDEKTETVGMLKIKTANTWMDEANQRAIPNMLFSELWYEYELCILFADTNLGKSILAVQLANSISRGEAIPGFKLEAAKQPVLYFDFELSDKQFENRYSIKYEQHYRFDEGFYRVEIDPFNKEQENLDFEEYLSQSIEAAIIKTGAKVLIIDNLTYLRDETEKAKDALPLMKHLNTLKMRYGLSILTLAHTPKRDMSRPITRNDVFGSKMLMNACDSSFAIGESTRDKNVRYIKQIKQRNTEPIFDSDNVCICQVCKPSNFLMFEFLQYGCELEHLKERTEQESNDRVAEALEMKKQGKSNCEIARTFNVSEGAVRKWFRKTDNHA